jgi:DNA-directed RNA polymerase subunit RPC12/RpoP
MPTFTKSGIRCGHCSSRLSRPIFHETVDDVRVCSGINPRQVYHNARTSIQAANAQPQIENQLATMLLGTKDGRYAVKMHDADPYKFLRLSRPNQGKAKGYLKIQSQHSEHYQSIGLIALDGVGSKRFLYAPSYVPYLRMLVCDPTTAAMDYGREMRRCSRCGIKLTDDRSRWFNIGPECEKYWPEIIAITEDKRGPYVPGWETK